MPTLHLNSTMDPEEEAVAFVEKLELEALDEDMVHGALERVMVILQSRQQVARERLNEELGKRFVDRRAELLKAKVKGVTPARRGSNLIEPAAVIPSRH